MKSRTSDVLNSLYFRRALLIVLDSLIVIASYVFAIYNASSVATLNGQLLLFKSVFPAVLLIQLIIFAHFRFYSSLWEYASIDEVSGLFLGVTAGVALSRVFCLVIGRQMDKSIFLLAWVVQFLLIGSVRFSYRYLRMIKRQKQCLGSLKRVMIVGAGMAGAWIAKEIRTNEHLRYVPVVFIDDDRRKHKCRTQGMYVAGGREMIPEAVKKYQVDEIILAIPSAPKGELTKIAKICSETGLKVKTLPSMHEIILKGANLSNIRDIDVHDFLGREEVNLNMEEVERFLKGSVVLVTGGGGSIGSELCRQIARFEPSKLIIFDIYENNAYDLQTELFAKYGERLNLKVLIGSVRQERLEHIFEKYRPDVVFHAAAHKHVPLMEDSPGRQSK